jgi:hypothetical protein
LFGVAGEDPFKSFKISFGITRSVPDLYVVGIDWVGEVGVTDWREYVAFGLGDDSAKGGVLVVVVIE